MNNSEACTTFCFQDESGHIVFGRNFDFPSGLGHVVVNHRNLQKTAFIRPPEKPITWVSKFGSISFNQNGREFPYGGMNEAGLVIEQMWLQETKYPAHDHRYGLSELQWIQYQLDNAATVQEVIDSDTLLRVSFTSVATLHFLVADKHGNVAAIEYLDGKMVVHQGEALRYPVLANCPYERSLEYKKHKDDKSSTSFTDWTENSSGRFATAAGMIKEYSPGRQNVVSEAFDILNAVSQGPSTQWSIVYDITTREIAWKTAANSHIRKISMNDFDFSCSAPALVVDINTAVDSPAAFLPYDEKTNFELIDGVCNAVEFLSQIPPEARRATAAYPNSIHCAE
ncbi:MAG: linear amide C-N hydrolase [Bacteroidota bacterium]